MNDEDKQWIREQLERVETALLTEFHAAADDAGRDAQHTTRRVAGYDRRSIGTSVLI